MTVTTTIARYPRCGNVESIYIRSDDEKDLVCRSQACRRSVTSSTPTEQAPLLRRILWRVWR